MYEAAIQDAAMFQLKDGVIPWSINITDSNIDPLPYLTSYKVGRAIDGYQLNGPHTNWRKAKCTVEHTLLHTHLVHNTGWLPNLKESFQWNLFALMLDIDRPSGGIEQYEPDTISYPKRAEAWYIGLAAFPKLYAAALMELYA